MSEIVSFKIVELPDGGIIQYISQWNKSRPDPNVRTIVNFRIHIDPNGNNIRSVSNDGCWREREPGDDGYTYYYYNGVLTRLEPTKIKDILKNFKKTKNNFYERDCITDRKTS